MQDSIFIDQRSPIRGFAKWLVFLGILCVLFKLWMVGGHEMLSKFRPHDDTLFAVLAINILEGNWLGEYGNKTLIKGIGYPLFMAISFWTGIPLLTLQHLLYVFSCLVMVLAFKPLVRQPSHLFVGFVLLLFNPLTYSYPLMSMTMRAGLYISLSLLVFSAATGLWLRRKSLSMDAFVWSLVLAFSFSWLWITREETVWILPALGVFIVMYLLPFSWNSGSSFPFKALMLIAPVVVFLATHFYIIQMNKAHYGVAVTNELKSPEFTSAMGGLMNIVPEQVEHHVTVSADAQEKAFEVSPTFATLKPYLEGESKMIDAFYIWKLRSAVRRAGLYDQPDDATREFAFYADMGAELRAACDNGQLECFDREPTLRPVWHPEYNEQAPGVFWDLTKKAVTFSLFNPYSAGIGSKVDLDTLFNYNILTGEDTLRNSVYFENKLPQYYKELLARKQVLMAGFGLLYKYGIPVLFCLALAFNLYLIAMMVVRRELTAKPVYSLIILGSIFTVLAMLTYVKISIWAVDRPMHTLSPLVLFYILYVFLPLEGED